MLDSFMICLNAVFPLVLLVVLGVVLSKTRFLSEEFFNQADKLVFKVVLPVYIFTEVSAKYDSEGVFDLKFVIFCFAGIIGSFLIFSCVTPLFIKNKASCGAFIQSVYRGNYAILGLPLAESFFPANGLAVGALIMPVAIPLFNVLAVIILTVNSGEGETRAKVDVKKMIFDIVTNPLIIAVFAGFLFMHIPMPVLAADFLGRLAKMSTPLALISLGACFRFDSLVSKLKYTIPAVAIRMVVMPIIITAIAIALGMRDVQLLVIFVLFSAPSAVSSYIMAKRMNSDHELAGQIVVLTTVTAAFTIFAGSFLLNLMGYISFV